MTNKIVVTGMGCICAAGQSVAETMSNIYGGVQRPFPPQDFSINLAQDYPVFAIDLNFEDKENFRTSLLAEKAAREALQQAGLTKDDLVNLRVGVCVGTTVGATFNNEAWYREFAGKKYPTAKTWDNFCRNNTAEYVADKFMTRGPAVTIVNACSSGTDAVGMARQWLIDDLCDVVIAGGADELSRITILGFVSLMIASPDICRPFDKNRSGLNLGEGAGILVMERAERARERGAEILAEAAGYATYADAYHPTAPDPTGKQLKRAIYEALGESGLGDREIDFINAHGTSTKDNDRVEGRALAEIFSAETRIVSTKGYTGHTLGAAGGLEAVFSIQSLLDGCIPATAGFVEADPQCGIEPTTRNIRGTFGAALSTSLAFGGNNSALVLKKGTS